MIAIEPMQNKRHTDENTLDKLIRHFNTIQLGTIQYNKHFETMEDIIVNEHWEEWEKFVLAAQQCENTMSKIQNNLKSMNIILINRDSKSKLEE